MSSSSPFFSIILPTFNRANLIPEALESLLSQTFANFEVIVVDDGSTDDTIDVIKRFSDNRIRYFYKSNEERSIARNFGILKASGMYVNFLDSDDYVYEHHLQTAYRHLNQKDFPEVLHLAYKESHKETLPNLPGAHKDINRRLIFNNTLYGGCLFVKREILGNLFFPPSIDANFSEDWYLWLRLAARYPIHTSDDVTVVVREHSERSLRKVDPGKLEKALTLIVDELRKDPAVLEYYKSSFGYFVAECYSLVALHYATVDKRKGLHYLRRSVQVSPLFIKRKRFWALLRNLFMRPVA